MPNPSRETKFSGANGDRGILIFPVQLTTSRIDNLTRLILTIATYDDHTYIPPLASKQRTLRTTPDQRATEDNLNAFKPFKQPHYLVRGK